MARPNNRDAILTASLRLLASHGFEGWSIDRVAREAGCAKALVIHHYGTRSDLLTATGARVAGVRQDRRLAALAEGGTEALDRLWLAVTEDFRTGVSRAAFSLAAQGYSSRGPGHAAALHAAVAKALDVPPEALADPSSLMAMLEGLEFQLMQGAEPLRLRPAFDRLWISLIEPA